MFFLQVQDTSGIPRLMFVGTLAMLILAIGIIVFVIFHQRKVIRYQLMMKIMNTRNSNITGIWLNVFEVELKKS